MGDGEIFVLLASVAAGGFAAFRWYRRLAAPSLVIDRTSRAWLRLAPPVGLAGVLVVLLTAASYDVRTAPQYILFYLALGTVWIFVVARLYELFGVSFRDDAVERRNPAAALALVGAVLAQTMIYAGANIGDGPGWWCVLVAGSIGAAAWLALWWVVEAACGVSEQITVERDLPTAVRLGGFMLGCGLICARGSAGDWTSFEQTVAEFAAAWPALVLTGAAVVLERELRRRPQARADLNTALLVALLWIGAAVLAVAFSPPLPENPLYDQAGPSGL